MADQLGVYDFPFSVGEKHGEGKATPLKTNMTLENPWKNPHVQ